MGLGVRVRVKELRDWLDCPVLILTLILTLTLTLILTLTLTLT